MLYRVTLAVDVEAATIQDASHAAQKAVSESAQRGTAQQGAAHVTRCEVTGASKL